MLDQPSKHTEKSTPGWRFLKLIEPDSMRDLRAPISVSGRKIPIRYRNQKGTRQRAHHLTGDRLHCKNVLLVI